ncbi:hypothetical protein INT43_004537 [Umbelopsis isabellina]|uniref:Uncharacterized protein n=1 Tax=Mortierella isabellina TaxID=91625 RepID=A0A8H7PGD3_MORIS|nr:hypothetical protein INT43_004537 [Umbelopsis isabellina]
MPIATLPPYHGFDTTILALIFAHLPDTQTVSAFRASNKHLLSISQNPTCIAAHLIHQYGPLFALHALIELHSPLLQRYPKIPNRLLDLGAVYPKLLAQRVFQGFGAHKGLPPATINLLIQNADRLHTIIHTNEDDHLLLNGMLTHLAVTEQEFGDTHPGFIGMQQALLRELPGYYPLPGPEYYPDSRVQDRIWFLVSHAGHADIEHTIFKMAIYCPRALAVLGRSGFSVTEPLDVSLFMVRLIMFGLVYEKSHINVSLRLAVRQVVQKMVGSISPGILGEIIESLARINVDQKEDLDRILVVIDEEIVASSAALRPTLDGFYKQMKRRSWWLW